MTAHIAIRPLHKPRIAVICRACGIEQPHPRHHQALNAAKSHNTNQHQGDNA
jgi:hypothetical protein